MEKRRSGLWSACLRTFNKARLLLPLLPRLGLANVANVAGYRLALGCGLIKKVMPAGDGYHDPLFHGSSHSTKDLSCPVLESDVVDLAEAQLKGNILYFSDQPYNVGSPPDWFFNPLHQKRYPDTDLHWSSLPDFSDKVGDIKIVWEASRFDWALVFARAYRVSGDERYLSALNKWSSDWTNKNPLNRGPNWKCGQEASIRVLNILLSAYLLGQDRSPTKDLVYFVREHCGRIAPTIFYAMSQDNNHGTSEAAALFICGGWLRQHVVDDGELLRKALEWEKKGRFWLENRVARLVADDGSFPQHSVNYHRLVVDTLSIVKVWQMHLGMDNFSVGFYRKARAAVNWLFQMVDAASGDAPNIGANDGAVLLNLTSCGFRDFRPSVQLGAAIFFNSRAYDKGSWDEVLNYFNLSNIEGFSPELEKKSQTLKHGGFVILHSDHSWGVARLPNFRFRPAHADALHLDLWYKGRNILRDGGSYSYNCLEPWRSYFPGTKSHNTVEFDGHDQMPRISRFLWGKWTKGRTIEPLTYHRGYLSWAGAYTDSMGCRQERSVNVKQNCWQITDTLSGFKSDAILRWRLEPGEWRLQGNVCFGNGISIELTSDSIPSLKLKLTDGWESRYYMKKSKIPVLEVLIKDSPSDIKTKIVFSSK